SRPGSSRPRSPVRARLPPRGARRRNARERASNGSAAGRARGEPRTPRSDPHWDRRPRSYGEPRGSPHRRAARSPGDPARAWRRGPPPPPCGSRVHPGCGPPPSKPPRRYPVMARFPATPRPSPGRAGPSASRSSSRKGCGACDKEDPSPMSVGLLSHIGASLSTSSTRTNVSDETRNTKEIMELQNRSAEAIRRLVAIMARLRGPDGCPWDREQTLDSLKPYLIEEAYEVLEAMDAGDSAEHCEELGDLLLQIVFHAELARESGRWDFADVAQAI